MELLKAENGRSWNQSSDILLAVARNLAQKGHPLWTENQLSQEGLQSAYTLDELHFLVQANDVVGVTFLQQSDKLFWPEIKTRDSMFLHKFAIHPAYSGQRLGQQAIILIKNEAINRGCSWLRLDCDNRQPLHTFYKGCGFKFVDLRQVADFRVARYEMPLSGEQKDF